MSIAADAPNVADWTAAIGQSAGALFTAAAVGVAVWLGWRDRKWRREEQTDRDAERRDSQAAQARLVTVDVEPFPDYSLTSEMVIVLNGSGAPITSVRIVEATNPVAPPKSWAFDSDTAFGDAFTIEPRVIPAGERFLAPVYFRGETGGAVASTEHTSVTGQLTDNAGLVWRRTDGDLPVRWDPATDRALIETPTPTPAPRR